MWMPPGESRSQIVEEDVNHWRGVKGKHLAEDESPNHRDTQRPPEFGTEPGAEGQRESAEQRRHGSHHDGPEAQQRRLIDSIRRILTAGSLSFQGKIDHHDSVLLHDADEK